MRRLDPWGEPLHSGQVVITCQGCGAILIDFLPTRDALRRELRTGWRYINGRRIMRRCGSGCDTLTALGDTP